MRQLLIYALAYAALFGAAVALLAPDALQDTPPDTSPSSTATETARLERQIRSLEREIEAMEQTADRYAKWKTCISWVPVNEVGDPDNTFGYGYDEKDGTGPTFMPALAVDPEDERPDYVFLKFARRDDCHSQPTVPGGTAEDASVDTLQTTLAASTSSTVRMLERKVIKLEEREEALERMSERFDEWESCLSWVPVTEYGDAEGRFGYLYTDEGGKAGYRAAIAVDGSEWDDPDYEFLAFAGRDRPFTGRECQSEPGEGVD